MRRIALFAVLAACLATRSGGEGGASADLAAALARQAFAEAELSLAERPRFYVVFDLDRGAVLLKAKGNVFREWEAREIAGSWGGRPPTGALRLERRSTLFPPKRVRLSPPPPDDGGEGKEAVAPAPPEEILEVADMPVRYRLRFADGTVVRVAPAPTGAFDRVASWLRRRVDDAALPLRCAWDRSRGGSGVFVYLDLEADDAKALYWAFSEGMEALFRYRGG